MFCCRSPTYSSVNLTSQLSKNPCILLAFRFPESHICSLRPIADEFMKNVNLESYFLSFSLLVVWSLEYIEVPEILLDKFSHFTSRLMRTRHFWEWQNINDDNSYAFHWVTFTVILCYKKIDSLLTFASLAENFLRSFMSSKFVGDHKFIYYRLYSSLVFWIQHLLILVSKLSSCTAIWVFISLPCIPNFLTALVSIIHLELT